MKNSRHASLLIVFTALIAAAPSPMRAAEPTTSYGPFVPRYLCPCPTPYCDKPCPHVCCLPKLSMCDHYCRKLMPSWCPPATCCPDNYCPKPLPTCFPPLPCKQATVPSLIR